MPNQARREAAVEREHLERAAELGASAEQRIEAEALQCCNCIVSS
jgi:hypothetical protein